MLTAKNRKDRITRTTKCAVFTKALAAVIAMTFMSATRNSICSNLNHQKSKHFSALKKGKNNL